MDFIDVQTPANYSQTKHKAFRALLSLWVIRRGLHIDKILKNKIHSYRKIMKLGRLTTDIPNKLSCKFDMFTLKFAYSRISKYCVS